jgi:hypothetical protein
MNYMTIALYSIGFKKGVRYKTGLRVASLPFTCYFMAFSLDGLLDELGVVATMNDAKGPLHCHRGELMILP